MPYSFGGIENANPSSSSRYPGSFGSGSDTKGQSSSPFSTPFEGFTSENFQGFGANSKADSRSDATTPGGYCSPFQMPFSFNAQPQQPTPMPPPPRRSVNDVLMNAQRMTTAVTNGATASPTIGPPSVGRIDAPPNGVASWAGIQVGMAPRPPPPPQCHVCRCMLHQQPAAIPVPHNPAAAAAPTTASFTAPSVADPAVPGGAENAVLLCGHCEFATCQSCASACSGCEGRFCLFCAGTSYLGRYVISKRIPHCPAVAFHCNYFFLVFAFRYEMTLCCQCHERASAELNENGGNGTFNSMDDA